MRCQIGASGAAQEPGARSRLSAVPALGAWPGARRMPRTATDTARMGAHAAGAAGAEGAEGGGAP
jgi:hypothetical protein